MSDRNAAGLNIGIVVNNQDPDKLGRVQVKFPSYGEETSSSWAHVLQNMAGGNYGVYMLPEVGDSVLVGFLNNNQDTPVVFGALYSGSSGQPDYYDSNNYTKAIKTKAGNEIKISDKSGEDAIYITSSDGKNSIKIDVKDNGKITVTAGDTIEFTAPNIKLSADKQITLTGGDITATGQNIKAKANENMDLESQQGTTIKSTMKVAINATQDATIEGLNITGTAQVGVTMKGNATAELSASGQTTVKGAMVMIN